MLVAKPPPPNTAHHGALGKEGPPPPTPPPPPPPQTSPCPPHCNHVRHVHVFHASDQRTPAVDLHKPRLLIIHSPHSPSHAPTPPRGLRRHGPPHSHIARPTNQGTTCPLEQPPPSPDRHARASMQQRFISDARPHAPTRALPAAVSSTAPSTGPPAAMLRRYSLHSTDLGNV